MIPHQSLAAVAEAALTPRAARERHFVDRDMLDVNEVDAQHGYRGADPRPG